jgi:microcystin-dependent protein
MPAHSHPVTFTSSSSLSYYYAYPPYTAGTVRENTGNTGTQGGGGAHNNLQPYIVTRKIIKYYTRTKTWQ